jgi:hypothetical protein
METRSGHHVGEIPGIARTNKLRILQLLEADLNQVLRAAFARNITKLAQNNEGVISEHQYGRLHHTCISPILNKLLTIQILIQKLLGVEPGTAEKRVPRS